MKYNPIIYKFSGGPAESVQQSAAAVREAARFPPTFCRPSSTSATSGVPSPSTSASAWPAGGGRRTAAGIADRRRLRVRGGRLGGHPAASQRVVSPSAV